MVEILAYTDLVQDWLSETVRCLNLNQYFWISKIYEIQNEGQCIGQQKPRVSSFVLARELS